jgi:hypothetical protein
MTKYRNEPLDLFLFVFVVLAVGAAVKFWMYGGW